MANMINFGIDLGTTNSSIAKFVKGDVEVFKDPLETGKVLLPSVLYYKKNRTFIGSQAKTYLLQNKYDVFANFKRTMGTSETFKVKCINVHKTPVELSSEIIKALKGFVHTGEAFDSAVITIPASFNIIQSNATKEAGLQAGLKNVVLLQEPIAASLAYMNKKKEESFVNGKWLVYDLGGGTFDVALMETRNGELKVLDHEGDNFLGGTDFDKLILDKLIIPYLSENYVFDDLEIDLKAKKGRLNSIYFKLLHKAEQAKIALSINTVADIEILDIEDDEGNEIDDNIELTRSEFDVLIKEYIDKTTDLINSILQKNSLKSDDIEFVLMVGGSTYIPFVRSRVGELLQTRINCDIDPTTAVSIGAAYYAGTKENTTVNEKESNSDFELKIKLAYAKLSNDSEEFLAGKVEGSFDNLYYQITRNDKGFNSGKKPLSKNINEDLPLLPDTYNYFSFQVFDSIGNLIKTNIDTIEIAHGKVTVEGQPLTNDISLERDIDSYKSTSYKNTTLDLFFKKNALLPLERQKTYTILKDINKNSNDKIVINICEGSHTNSPKANFSIGYFEITGEMIDKNLIKGTDFEITLKISESRDFSVDIYIPYLDQQFTKQFRPENMTYPLDEIKRDVSELNNRIDKEMKDAVELEDYETAEILKPIKTKLNQLTKSSKNEIDFEDSDKRFQFENEKRKIAQAIDDATSDKKMQILLNEYFEAKKWSETILSKYGNDEDYQVFSEITSQEELLKSTGIPSNIEDKIDEIYRLTYNILWRVPDFLKDRFNHLKSKSYQFNNQERAKELIESGEAAISEEKYDSLKNILLELISLLPKSVQNKDWNPKIGF